MKKKIRQDKYGVYIQTNCSIYRPQQSTHAWVDTTDLNRGDTTVFKKGDEVNAHHISQTPHAEVKRDADGYIETWHTHGFRKQGTKSEDYWNPKNE